MRLLALRGRMSTTESWIDSEILHHCKPRSWKWLKGNIFLVWGHNRVGLGYDFFLQIEAGINFIKRNPKTHPIEYKETRKHLIKRFPYKIIYFVKEEKIIVLAVLHGKRSFELLKNRVNGIWQAATHWCSKTIRPASAKIAAKAAPTIISFFLGLCSVSMVFSADITPIYPHRHNFPPLTVHNR